MITVQAVQLLLTETTKTSKKKGSVKETCAKFMFTLLKNFQANVLWKLGYRLKDQLQRIVWLFV